MTTHSSFPAWEIPWTEELGWLESMGLQESDMTQRLNNNQLTVSRKYFGRKVKCSCSCSLFCSIHRAFLLFLHTLSPLLIESLYMKTSGPLHMLLLLTKMLLPDICRAFSLTSSDPSSCQFIKGYFLTRIYKTTLIPPHHSLSPNPALSFFRALFTYLLKHLVFVR